MPSKMMPTSAANGQLGSAYYEGASFDNIFGNGSDGSGSGIDLPASSLADALEGRGMGFTGAAHELSRAGQEQRGEQLDSSQFQQTAGRVKQEMDMPDIPGSWPATTAGAWEAQGSFDLSHFPSLNGFAGPTSSGTSSAQTSGSQRSNSGGNHAESSDLPSYGGGFASPPQSRAQPQGQQQQHSPGGGQEAGPSSSRGPPAAGGSPSSAGPSSEYPMGTGGLNKSRYRGVSYDKKKRKWRVQIKVASLGKSGVSVGYFDTEEAAARAYDRAAIGLLGREHCSITTNFPLSEYDKEQVPQLIGRTREEVKTILKSERAKVPRRRFTSRQRTSRYMGVGSSNRKNQWQARILVHGKVTHLGYYETEEEAARVYDRVAISLHGAAAQTNFPGEQYDGNDLDGFSGLGREELQRALGVKPMDKSSRYRGVSKKKGKWEAKVMVNRKWAYRELFDSEEEAARAYDQAVWRLKPKEAKSYVNFKERSPPLRSKGSRDKKMGEGSSGSALPPLAPVSGDSSERGPGMRRVASSSKLANLSRRSSPTSPAPKGLPRAVSSGHLATMQNNLPNDFFPSPMSFFGQQQPLQQHQGGGMAGQRGMPRTMSEPDLMGMAGGTGFGGLGLRSGDNFLQNLDFGGSSAMLQFGQPQGMQRMRHSMSHHELNMSHAPFQPPSPTRMGSLSNGMQQGGRQGGMLVRVGSESHLIPESGMMGGGGGGFSTGMLGSVLGSLPELSLSGQPGMMGNPGAGGGGGTGSGSMMQGGWTPGKPVSLQESDIMDMQVEDSMSEQQGQDSFSDFPQMRGGGGGASGGGGSNGGGGGSGIFRSMSATNLAAAGGGWHMQPGQMSLGSGVGGGGMRNSIGRSASASNLRSSLLQQQQQQQQQAQQHAQQRGQQQQQSQHNFAAQSSPMLSMSSGGQLSMMGSGGGGSAPQHLQAPFPGSHLPTLAAQSSDRIAQLRSQRQQAQANADLLADMGGSSMMLGDMVQIGGEELPMFDATYAANETASFLLDLDDAISESPNEGKDE